VERRRGIDLLLGPLGLEIDPGDRVLQLGCGPGPATGELAERAAHVVAVGLDPARLAHARDVLFDVRNVTWVQASGIALDPVPDASVDAVVATDGLGSVPGTKAQLALVEEVGRVLRPGGWAALWLSTDPASGAREAPPAPADDPPTRRDLFRSLGRRARPGPPPPPAGAFVPLDALGAVATSAGLVLDRIEGSNTEDTLVLAIRA
jgi:ubiquinone/menaquinone biosynthesis C-methylase UbiE